MVEDKGSMKFKLRIAASPSDVYHAFTSGAAFCEWLCDEAQVDARQSGHLYLWWQDGYFANGDYLELIPNEKIVFSWHGAGEPGLTRVKLTFKCVEQGAYLTLTHQGIGSESAWKKTRKQYKRSWSRALENLRSVLETGQDLRFVNRPRLGFCELQELNPAQAAEAGLPPRAGLLVRGVEADTFAAEAGLQTGDLLVKFAGLKVESLTELGSALESHRAGEKVKLGYYRGGEKLSAKARLSRCPTLEVPLQADVLAETVSKQYDRFSVELDGLLAGVSEEAAEYRSDAEEWSVKDVLAHLIATERELQAWIARRIVGQEANFVLYANQPVRIRAIISNFPTLAGLKAELKRNQAETVAIAYDLPEEFVARRQVYWRVGYILLQTSARHLADHLVQIRETLEKARQAPGGEVGRAQASEIPAETAEQPTQRWYEF